MVATWRKMILNCCNLEKNSNCCLLMGKSFKWLPPGYNLKVNVEDRRKVMLATQCEEGKA